MATTSDKIPQRIQDVLMQIGEQSTVFQLYLLTRKCPGWEVYQNLSDTGCDVLLVNSLRNDKIRIEVKTRQHLLTTSKHEGTIQFTVTENEQKNADFLVCYLVDLRRFFVVPPGSLRQTSSNGTPVFKFDVRLTKSKQVTKGKNYEERWDLIEQRMA